MCPSGQFGLEAITRLEEEQNLLMGGTGGMRPPILEQILIFTYYVYTYRIWIWIQKGLFKREGAGGGLFIWALPWNPMIFREQGNKK